MHMPGVFEQVHNYTLKELKVNALSLAKLLGYVDLESLCNQLHYFYKEQQDDKYCFRRLFKENPEYYLDRLKETLNTQFDGLFILHTIFSAYTHALEDLLAETIEELENPMRDPQGDTSKSSED